MRNTHMHTYINTYLHNTHTVKKINKFPNFGGYKIMAQKSTTFPTLEKAMS